VLPSMSVNSSVTVPVGNGELAACVAVALKSEPIIVEDHIEKSRGLTSGIEAFEFSLLRGISCVTCLKF
jgi:hypothetical protein